MKQKKAKSAVSRKLSDVLSRGIIVYIESGENIDNKFLKKYLSDTWRSEFNTRHYRDKLVGQLSEFADRYKSGKLTRNDEKRRFSAIKKFNAFPPEKRVLAPSKKPDGIGARPQSDDLVLETVYWELKDYLRPDTLVSFAYPDAKVIVNIMGQRMPFNNLSEAAIKYPDFQKMIKDIDSGIPLRIIANERLIIFEII